MNLTQQQTKKEENLRQIYLEAMSRVACTVSVVTTDGSAGKGGVTVSTLASVTADTSEPILLVCVHHQSPTCAKILENGVFCVNVLSADQAFIADTFAGRIGSPKDDKFACCDWLEMPSGSLRVADPLIAFDCATSSAERVGTHFVLFGKVMDIFLADKGSALLYTWRDYTSLSEPESGG